MPHQQQETYAYFLMPRDEWDSLSVSVLQSAVASVSFGL